ETEHVLRAVGFDRFPRQGRGVWPDAYSLNLEIRTEQCLELVGTQVANDRNQPMRRQNHQTWIVHADQHHQDEIRGMIRVGRFTCLTLFLEILERRFIAMVPVGDENWPGPQEAADRADGLLVGHWPKLADDAQMIDGLDRQRPADGGIELGRDLARFIGEQSENLTEIHRRRAEQLEAIRFRTGHRLLVWINAAAAEGLQTHAGHEPL